QCMKCLLHGNVQTHCSQDCPMNHCSCAKCQLVDSRRNAANKLWRLGRKQKEDLGISGHSVRYTCARCRNHGIVVLKKHHTPCPYSMCHCEECMLIGEKNRIDCELKAIAR
ncbi:hypothetical protein PMAYCL1PPCAC_00267, partial [Pristionchus mayeri]